MDTQKAIDCYKFFYAHSYMKFKETETFLTYENIKVFYNLNFESKREIYEQMLNNE